MVVKSQTAKIKAGASLEGYSKEYESIRLEVESKWPDWKITTYNNNFAISSHAKKVLAK